MKTKIFAYKGEVGAETDLENGKFLNNPLDAGQIGCLISSNEVEITEAAKEIMKTNYSREGGSFSSVMLTRLNDGGGSSLGLLGFQKHYLGKTMDYSRDCDLSVIDDFTVVDMETPKSFKEFIDSF